MLKSYMKASHAVFLLWVPLMGACLLLCILIKDKGLTRPEEKEKARAQETSGSELEIEGSGESDVEMQAQGKTEKK